MPFQFEPANNPTAFLFSAAIGSVFGAVPALRAAASPRSTRCGTSSGQASTSASGNTPPLPPSMPTKSDANRLTLCNTEQ